MRHCPSPASGGRQKENTIANMDKIALVGFLIVATSLEAVGDAVVRMGIAQNAWLPRCLLFVTGAVLLFGYGLSVNLAPVEFGRVVGLYIAMLFIVWQIVNWIVFRSLPDAPIFVGGVLIIVGGAIVTLWK
jgi:small multidrug resistance family-3 protein